MSPVIRIDDQVYAWLQAKARPFEDTPNSVLRAMAGLGADRAQASPLPSSKDHTQTPKPSSPPGGPKGTGRHNSTLGKRLSGKLLAREWKVPVRHPLYHKDGTWYENLREFPGALFDPNGYVVFRTEEEYHRCPQLTIGEKTNVSPHISAIRGYVRMER